MRLRILSLASETSEGRSYGGASAWSLFPGSARARAHRHQGRAIPTGDRTGGPSSIAPQTIASAIGDAPRC